MSYITNLIGRRKESQLEEHDEDRRGYLAKKYIKGRGVEIGALHKPVPLGDGVVAKYVDYKDTKGNRKRYPELSGERIVKTDIIDNGFFLKKIKDHSLDFIIANHFLEHSPDPIGTLNILRSKLKVGGILFLAVPRLDKNYDSGRQLTSLDHLTSDYEMFQDSYKNLDNIIARSRDHLIEFLHVSDGNIRKMNGMKPKFTTLKLAEKEADNILASFREQMKEIASQGGDALNQTKSLSKKKQSNKETLYEKVMNAHIYKLNLLYDIHYHTFSPESYQQFFRLLEKKSKGKFKLEEISISGIGEVIAIVKNTTTK